MVGVVQWVFRDFFMVALSREAYEIVAKAAAREGVSCQTMLKRMLTKAIIAEL